MLRTYLSVASVARLLADIIARVVSCSVSGPVMTVPFGDAVAVSVGDACLATVYPADGGVSVEWAPDSSEARSLLLPLLDAALGA